MLPQFLSRRRQLVSGWIAAVLLSSVLAGSSLAGTVSGRARYEDRPVTDTGFGTSTFLPCRFNEVEIVLAAGTSLGTGTCDVNGNYTVTIPDQGSQSLFLRVYARRLTGNFNLLVLNNTLQQLNQTARTGDQTVNTNLAITIDIDVTVSSTAAGAFNIYDQGIRAQDLLRTLSGSTPPRLTFYWQTGSTDGTFFSPSENAIHLLGQSSDPDEFDDDVILHETGHYLQANFSRDDTPAGPHAQSDSHQDLRLAWSEGSAYWWSGTVSNNATQRDFTAGGVSRFEMETPSNSTTGTGADTETAVEAVLWDIQDLASTPDSSPGFDDDGIQLNDAAQRIFNVLNREFSTGRDTTLETFYTGWFTQNGVSFRKTELDEILAGRQINFNRQSLFENGSDLTIPDSGATVESTISVAQSINLTGVRVFTDVAHTAPEQLVVQVVHPDGTVVTLHSRTDTQPGRDIFSWYEPFDAPLPPGQNLNSFNGKNGSGTWRLRLQDQVTGTVGTLRRWRLSLLGGVNSADLTVAGVTGPASATPGAVIGVQSRIENRGPADTSTTFTCTYFLSENATITSADTPLLSFSVNGLGAGDGIDDARTVVIPANTPLGSRFLGLIVDTTAAVGEANENNNAAASPTPIAIVAANSPPDLVVASLTAPATGNVGGSLAVTSRVENRGDTGVSVSFANRYVLSVDSSISEADTDLGSFTINSLGVGGGFDDSRTVTIPAAVLPGSYFLGLIADAGGAVTESSEANNALAAPSLTALAAPPSPPDLAAIQVIGPRSASLGSSIIVSVTFRNNGGTGIGQIFSGAVFLSSDTVITAGDRQLGTFATNGIGAGEQVVRNLTVGLPADATVGTAFLGVLLDVDDVVAESNENNNAAVDTGGVLLSPPPQQEDLVAISVVSPSAASIGDTLPVTAQIDNSGGTSITSTFVVRFFVSRTRTPLVPAGPALDVVVNGLPATSSRLISGGLSLPTTLPAGGYFVAAVADATGVVTEAREDNNTVVPATSVQVSVPIRPDLSGVSIGVPAGGFVGGRLEIQPRFANQGNGASGTFQSEFFLSTSATILASAVSLGVLNFASLAAGEGRTSVATVSVPSRVAAGTYRIGARIDPGGLLPEGDETNNEFISAASVNLTIPILPDLTVVSVDAPATAEVGGQISIRRTIRNQGSSDANQAFSEAIVLATTGAISVSSQRIATFGNTSLAAGLSSNVNRSVVIPATLAPGSYFLGVLVDPDNRVQEKDEENNALAALAPTLVAASRKPDLIVDLVSAPSTILATRTFQITRRVRNGSQFGSLQGFQEVYYLSVDSTITSEDTPIASFVGPQLAPLASHTTTRTVQLPGGIPGGAFFVGLIVNAGVGVEELTSINNSLAASGSVNVVSNGVLPDLVPTSLTVPSAATPGTTLTVQRRLENQGRGSLLVSFEESYFLSARQDVTTTDLALGTFTNGALTAGGVNVASRGLTLPATLTPGSYLLAVVLDPQQRIQEGDATGSTTSAESNNLLAASTPIQVGTVAGARPDLTVADVATAREIQRGTSTAVTATVVNGGQVGANGFEVRFYLSVNKIVDGDGRDTVLGNLASAPLLAGGRTTLQGFFTVPSTQPVGNYFILAQVDSASQVTEADELNNVSPSGQVSVVSTLTLPDLLAESLAFSPLRADTGEPVSLAWSIRNLGGQAAEGFRVRFFASTDTTIASPDTLLVALELPGLAAGGATLTDVTTPVIPAALTTGTYFLGMVVDDDNRIDEADLRNNSVLAPGTFAVGTALSGPDLVASTPTAASSATVGAAFSVSLSLANLGPVSVLNDFKNRLFLSRDKVLDGSDLQLDQFTSSGLPQGGQSQVSRTFTLPRTTPGSYELLFVVDATNVVTEDIETNNLSSSSLLLRGAPDLVPTTLTGPTVSVGVDVPFPVRFSMINQGSAAAQGPILSRVLLSPDSTLDATDLVLKPVIFSGDLAIGQSASFDTTASIPNFVTPGVYSLALVVDATGSISEEDESNNSLVAGLPIRLGGSPDLKASEAVVPASILAGSGQELQVQASVANLGGATAPASGMGFFLSLDRTAQASDPFLGSVFTPSLEPTRSTVVSGKFLISGSFTPGEYFLIARADFAGVVAETDESAASNDTVSPTTVRVLASTTDRPKVQSIVLTGRPDATAIRAGPLEIAATYDRSLSQPPLIAVDQTGTNDLAPTLTSGSGRVWRYQYAVPEDNRRFNLDGPNRVTFSGGADSFGVPAETFTTAAGFVTDTIAPVATVGFPQNGGIVGRSILISGSFVEASGRVSISIASGGADAGAATINAGSFERQVTLSQERTLLTVRAVDAAGNTGPDVRLTVLIDSDGDGMSDEFERIHELDSADSSDGASDLDQDGLTNLQESRAGTSPRLADTDGDGVGDGVEVAQGTDPVNGSNRRPIATAREGAASAARTGPRVATLDGSASVDPDGDPVAYRWTQVGGALVELIRTGSPLASAVLRAAGSYRFRLVVNDGRVDSTASEVSVSVANAVPTAAAGMDQTVVVASPFRLDGTASTDPNGGRLTYGWTEGALNPVLGLLTDPTSPDPQVTAVVAGKYEFVLRVTDTSGASSSSSRVNVRVMDPLNRIIAPRADAGLDQTVDVGTVVRLDGHESVDPDAPSLPLTYSWLQTGGPQGVARLILANASTVRPAFTAGSPGTYLFQLVVSDDADDRLTSEAATVRVRVNGAASTLPLASPGADREIPLGDTAILDGTGSRNRSGTALTYAWKQIAGDPVTIDGASTAMPTVTPIIAGTYRFELTVTDGATNSEPATVKVHVAGAGDGRPPVSRPQLFSPASSTPTEQRVRIPAGGSLTVTLDGSESFDPEGRALRYRWRQVLGPRVVLSSQKVVRPTFEPLVSRVYGFELDVNDGSLESTGSTFVVVDTAANSVPRATVSTTPVGRTGELVVLDGSSSIDGDGTGLFYQWVQVGGLPVTLIGALTAQLSFVPPVDGRYDFLLYVDDGGDRSVPVPVSIASSAATPGGGGTTGGTTTPTGGGTTGTSSGGGGGSSVGCNLGAKGQPAGALGFLLPVMVLVWLKRRRRGMI